MGNFLLAAIIVGSAQAAFCTDNYLFKGRAYEGGATTCAQSQDGKMVACGGGNKVN